MEIAVKLCFGLILVLFNSNRLVDALSCPCHNLPNKCSTPTPTDCKGDITKDACGCCDVCAKVKDEECGGPFRTSGKCSRGFICKYESYEEPLQSKGICITEYPKEEGEPCGEYWTQGHCKQGFKCQQPNQYSIGKCLKDS
ncbi:unnamed protein product [Gordionus sp. m RMFG-2023]|uniref:venom protein 302-like n=1 Tax=Gordionus sp. m RMFG-2023 TaxID=3053472 RepID=UPI0030E201E3